MVEAFVTSVYYTECVQSTRYPKDTYKRHMYIFLIFVYLLFIFVCAGSLLLLSDFL